MNRTIAPVRIRGWSPAPWPSLGQPVPAAAPPPPPVVQRPANPLEWRSVGFLTNAATSVVGFMVAPRLRTPVRDPEGKVTGHRMNFWSWAAYGVAGVAALRAFNDYSRIT